MDAITEQTLSCARIDAPPAGDERRRAIAAGRVRSQQFVPLRGGYAEVPVVSVSERDLLYRVANGRIVAELEDLLAADGRSLADLSASEEETETQQLLHDLLIAKAADPAGPVLQEMARHGQQTEPLLITADGVLVNGNRRLAAMRELLARDPGRYGAFAQVTAGVLPPDLDEAEIEFIEAALQMAPEVKLAYGWINRRMKLRHQHETLGLSAEAIADAYRMDAPEQVAVELEELRLAEHYLRTFKGGLDHALVADLEPFFRGLRAQLAGLAPRLRETWGLAACAMIDGRAAVAEPMERFFPFAKPAPPSLPEWTLRRLAEEAEILPLVDGQRAGPANVKLPTDALIALKRRFGDPERSAENAASLFGMMEQLRAEHQEARAPHAAIKLVERARTALAQIEIGRMTAKQLRELRLEMVALEASVASLLGEEPPIPTTAPPTPGLVARLLGRS